MKLLLISLLAFSSLAAFADWKKHPESIVVKVSSCFTKDPDNCLEGSGVLVKMAGGGVGVLTSEHVVIPSNDDVFHYVLDSKGRKSRAYFALSNWEGGIALLDFYNRDAYSTEKVFTKEPADFPQLSKLPKPDVRTKQSLTAYGFPAGSHVLVRTTGGQSRGVFRRTAILAIWDVIETRGLITEFGMSGGPVFTEDGELFGLMSHVSFEEDPKTFLIPIQSAIAWESRPWASEFERTPDDLKRQFFSRSKPETVHLNPMGLTVQKVGSKFIVDLKLPTAETADMSEVEYQRSKFRDSAIGGTEWLMRMNEYETVVFDHTRDGGSIGDLTLVEFIRSYVTLQLPFDVPFQVVKKAPHKLQPWEQPE